MKNRCFYHSQVFSKCKGLEISYFGWKTAVSIKTRCLGSVEGSKSAIQMENNRLYQNQVFRKCRDFKISYRYFRWNTAFYIKIWCLGSADGSKSAINFRRKPAISIKVRCLVSAKGSKSAISDGKQLFISKSGVQEVQRTGNQLFRWKTVIYITSYM